MKNTLFSLVALLIFIVPAASNAQSASSMSSPSSASLQSSSFSSSSLSVDSSTSSSMSSVLSSSSSRMSSVSSRISSRSSRASSVSSARLTFGDIDLDRYSDAPWDHETNVSVSVLTEIGVLFGNDDGTFRPDRSLNRAEFMQIVMRLLPSASATINLNCFPDVRASDWYAEAVCRAKASGIVRGNVVEGVPASQWRFEPSRDVQYEEVVKILAKMYALPVSEGEGFEWYVPFIEAAEDAELTIDDLIPGDRITRGEMARITTAFLAYSTDQLDELRDAEIVRSSHSSSRMSSRSSMSASSHSGMTDTNDDLSIRSNILLLGEVSSPLAGVRFFSNDEPIHVSDLNIELVTASNSVDSFLIYDSQGQLLGTARNSGTSTTYRASITEGRFTLPRREDRSIYVRARLKTENNGGVSGEMIEVESIQLVGSGEWTNEEYTTTSSDDFTESQTAIGRITNIANAGSTNGILVSGNDQVLGEYRVVAETSVGGDDVQVTGINFTIEQTGNVTLSNVELGVAGGSSDRHSCSVAGLTVTCSSIPASIGTVGETKTLRLFGDVSVPSNSDMHRLRLVINDPGTSSTAGAVTWTDGDTAFQWLPLSQPVARGVLLED